MKKLLYILFVFLPLFGIGQTTYYISNSGSTGNSGTSTSSTWPFSKVNSTSFANGDVILFHSGESFYGKIIVNASVTYGSYGSGAKPIITGFTTVSSWTNLGGNIWESSSAISTLSDAKVVVINGKNTVMGHTPNIQSDEFRSNYYTLQSHSGNTSITSSSLSGSPNWTGADVVIRDGDYQFNKATITSQSGGTLNFPATNNTPPDGYGFWIQNDIRTLDSQNEWYYNHSTKKLDVYSTTQPTDVKVTTIDTLFYNYNRDNVTIDGLDFEGANTTAIVVSNAAHNTITNCNLHFIGQYAIDYNHSSSFPVVTYNDFQDVAVYCFFNQDYTGAGYYAHNNFNRIALVSSWLPYDEGSGAISQVIPGSIIEYNRLDSFGRKGIIFRGADVICRYNYITYGALVKQDAGGIYTGFENETGKQIYNNIVTNMEGNSDGTGSTAKAANGFYFDDWSNNLKAYNNTAAYIASAAYFLHNAYYDTLYNNIAYDHSTSGSWTKGGLIIQTDANKQTHPTRNNRITNNVFFALAANRYAIFSYNGVSTADSKLYGVSDSNFYDNPIASDVNMFDFYDHDASTDVKYSLSSFRSFSGNDAHSVGSPKFVNSTDSVVFVFNPTDHDSTITLAHNYEDARSNQFNATITLSPYTSNVLIQNGTATNIAAPTISMSGNQTITVDNATVSAVASWASGHSGTYHWTKISGPGAQTFSAVSSNSTGITGLQTGTYDFRCTLTQDDGQTAYGDVTIDVTLPVAAPTITNSGNKTTTIDSVSITATPVWASGQTGTVHWTQISGPNTAVIYSYNSNSTWVKSLISGTYVFRCTATQSDGQTVYTDVTVVKNIPPVSNPGQNIITHLNKIYINK